MALLYAKSHEWFNEESGKVGISEYAADALVDIVFVDLPEVGTEVKMGESFASLESVKAVSDVFSPVSGVVVKVNEALMDSPELINEDALNSWFIMVEVKEITDDLMGEQAYKAYCESNAEA